MLNNSNKHVVDWLSIVDEDGLASALLQYDDHEYLEDDELKSLCIEAAETLEKIDTILRDKYDYSLF